MGTTSTFVTKKRKMQLMSGRTFPISSVTGDHPMSTPSLIVGIYNSLLIEGIMKERRLAILVENELQPI